MARIGAFPDSANVELSCCLLFADAIKPIATSIPGNVKIAANTSAGAGRKRWHPLQVD
jgi:hypothetical protein